MEDNTFKSLKIKRCQEILDEAENNSLTEKISDSNKLIFFVNKYNLTIPQWLYEINAECCCIIEQLHLSTIMFNELMNSISNRKFNGGDIPSNYIILPSDWTDCYEDGYPILCDKDILQMYEDSFLHFINNMSKDDLIDYIHHNKSIIPDIIRFVARKYTHS